MLGHSQATPLMTVTGSALSLLIYYQLGLSEYQHNLPAPGVVNPGQLSLQSGQGLRGRPAHLLFQGILTAGFKLLIYFFGLCRKSVLKKKRQKYNYSGTPAFLLQAQAGRDSFLLEPRRGSDPWRSSPRTCVTETSSHAETDIIGHVHRS